MFASYPTSTSNPVLLVSSPHRNSTSVNPHQVRERHKSATATTAAQSINLPVLRRAGAGSSESIVARSDQDDGTANDAAATIHKSSSCKTIRDAHQLPKTAQAHQHQQHQKKKKYSWCCGSSSSSEGECANHRGSGGGGGPPGKSVRKSFS